MTGPVDLIHRSTPATGYRHDGSDDESRQRIVQWVTEHGGEAVDTLDDLLVKTPVKWAPVLPDWWVIRGVVGQFFVIEPDVYAGSYDRVIVDYGSDLSLSDDQLRDLRDRVHATSDPVKLRELADLAIAAALDRGGMIDR